MSVGMNALLLLLMLCLTGRRRIFTAFETPLNDLLQRVLRDADSLLLQAARPQASPVRMPANQQDACQWPAHYESALHRMVRRGCPMAAQRLQALRRCLEHELQVEQRRWQLLEDYGARIIMLILLSAILHVLLGSPWLLPASQTLAYGLAFLIFLWTAWFLQSYLGYTDFCRHLAVPWVTACLSEEAALLGVSIDYDRYLEHARRHGRWAEDLRLQLLDRPLAQSRTELLKRIELVKNWLPLIDLAVASTSLVLMNMSIVLEHLGAAV